MTEQTKLQWMIVLHVALMFFGVGLFRTSRLASDSGSVSDGASWSGDCGSDGGADGGC